MPGRVPAAVPHRSRLGSGRCGGETRRRSVVAAERRNGVIKRLMVHPVTRLELVMGKIYGLMLLGAVHWVTKWFSPDGAWTAQDASAALIELATRGLAAKPARRLSSVIHKSSSKPFDRKEEMPT